MAPLVILEAMASKIPWVSLPVGKVRELEGGVIATDGILNYNILKDVEDNILYDTPLIEQFSKALMAILQNDTYREDLGNKGNDLIREKLSFDKIIPRYNDIFVKERI